MTIFKKINMKLLNSNIYYLYEYIFTISYYINITIHYYKYAIYILLFIFQV